MQGIAFASIDSVISDSQLAKGSLIAVSVKDLQYGNVLYEKNSNKLMLPASVLKLFTIKPSLAALGDSYEFVTEVYGDLNGNLYIKLSGNPNFTSDNLAALIAVAKEKSKNKNFKTIYIDDYVLDGCTWGAGWSWDNNGDDGIPQFGAYNIDKNVIPLNIYYDGKTQKVTAGTQSTYKTNIVNLLEPASYSDINVVKRNGVVYLSGKVASNEKIKVPVDDIQDYFVCRLKAALNLAGVSYKSISFARVPKEAELLAEHSQRIEPVIIDIFKKSDNFAAETVFKTAGGKYTNSTGSIEDAVKMFNNYYKKIGISPAEIAVVDASGLSRKNMLTADWTTKSLAKFSSLSDFEQFKRYMAQPGEGTLRTRLIDYKGLLRAKTGTLDGVSAIAGYITTQKGTNVAFCVYVQNFKQKASTAKLLENNIVKEIYENY